jgi:membrane peptidoglycan carboxypeptidase
VTEGTAVDMRGKAIRRVGYVLIVLALVVGFIVYQRSSDSDPAPVAESFRPVKVRWPDGGEFGTFTRDGVGSTKMPPSMEVIWERAKRELNDANVESEAMFKGGYTVVLTVDPKVQALAQNTIAEATTGQPPNLREALAAVDPANGRIVAYAGFNQAKAGLDYAGQVWQNPGSLFMPFDLVALLHQGKGLGETYDGTSPRKFGNTSISNAPGTACQKCSVAEAMRLSTDTVFADVAFNGVGTRGVAKAAIEAGIPSNVGARSLPIEGSDGNAPNVNIALGGGEYQARVTDIAGAYATFAANGKRATPHLVAQVRDGDKVVYDGDVPPRPAFDQKDETSNAAIARNVTESLLPIPSHAKVLCADARPCAGKPATQKCMELPGKTLKTDTCVAWMAGYTPQISTAVWIGTDTNEALKTADGAAIEGSGLPGKIWQKFMDGYHAGMPVQNFPAFVPIGRPS